MKRLLCAAVLVVSSLASMPSAKADPGLRFGLTDEPNTVFLGMFYEAPISRTRSSIFVLEPGGDVGFGSDIDFFTLRGTLNAKFLFPLGRRNSFYVYPLFGVSVYYVNVDNGGDDTGAGLNLGGGFGFDRFNFDFSVGFVDIPDFTFSFGFTF